MHASDHPIFLQRRWLAAACVRWLLLGSALVLLLPAARGSNLWIGWLPYWLCVAPAMCLLLLQRHSIKRSLLQSLSASRSHRSHRSRRRPRRQARRQPSRVPLRSLSLAGLLGR